MLSYILWLLPFLRLNSFGEVIMTIIKHINVYATKSLWIRFLDEREEQEIFLLLHVAFVGLV